MEERTIWPSDSECDVCRRVLAAAVVLLCLVAPVSAANYASIGVSSGGAYVDGAIWGGARGDWRYRRFRLVAEGQVGNAAKESATRGTADDAYAYRLTLAPLACWSDVCAGPRIGWAGYRSEWDDGAVWEKDDVTAGATIGWTPGPAQFWIEYARWNDPTQTRFGLDPLVESFALDAWWVPSRWGVRVTIGQLRISGDNDNWSDGSVAFYVVRRFGR